MDARPATFKHELQEFEAYSIEELREMSHVRKLGGYYLKSNIEKAYHLFRVFLYVHSDDDEEVPSRTSPEMREKFRELVAQDSGISAEMIDRILNSFWALDLQQVEEDATKLGELLAAEESCW